MHRVMLNYCHEPLINIIKRAFMLVHKMKSSVIDYFSAIKINL